MGMSMMESKNRLRANLKRVRIRACGVRRMSPLVRRVRLPCSSRIQDFRTRSRKSESRICCGKTSELREKPYYRTRSPVLHPAANHVRLRIF